MPYGPKRGAILRGGHRMFERISCIRKWTWPPLLVLVMSCRDAGAPDVPERGTFLMTAVSDTTMTAVVGEEVVMPPAVQVTDVEGRPIGDVQVTFRVTRGAGFVTAVQTRTNSSGIAETTRWTLGNSAELNIVEATAGRTNSVRFYATALAGPPHSVEKVAGDGQTALAGSALGVRPQVRVVDRLGNGLPHLTVTFSVEVGGGALTESVAVTDSSGIAEAGTWILGSGLQRLVARHGILWSEPFTATAIGAPPGCDPVADLRRGVNFLAHLTDAACPSLDGRPQTMFVVTVATPGLYVFSMESLEFDTDLELRSANFVEIGRNDNVGFSRTNSELTALLPAGLYFLVARSSQPAKTGRFSVRFDQAGADVERCAEVFVARGTETRQTATTSDCVVSQFEMADRYRVHLEAGSSLSLVVEDWNYTGPNVEVVTPSGTTMRGSSAEAYIARLSFVAPVTGYYTLYVGLTSDRAGSEYTLRIN
jgi:hypothetical protein